MNSITLKSKCVDQIHDNNYFFFPIKGRRMLGLGVPMQ